MQRKNNLLKKSGMALIMAIAVIVILSTIMALSLSLSVETTKRTTDLYIYEQSILYSKSAAELALLEIANNGCIENFNTNFNGTYYDANVTLRYVYTHDANTINSNTCNNYFQNYSNRDGNSYIYTSEQNGSVLMDITVSINDDTVVSEPIHYFRRSIQKL